MTKVVRTYTVDTVDSDELQLGQIERSDHVWEDAQVCESCNHTVWISAATWIQGERPTPPDQPDTMVVVQCLDCFFTSGETRTIILDDVIVDG